MSNYGILILVFFLFEMLGTLEACIFAAKSLFISH